MSEITILVIEDDPAVRRGIVDVLDTPVTVLWKRRTATSEWISL